MESIQKMIKKNTEDIKITLLIEKKGKQIKKKLSSKFFHDLYDIQFMIDDGDHETFKTNGIDVSFDDFMKICALVIDCESEGKTYKLVDGRLLLSDTKFYHSGKKPEWDNEGE